MLRLKSYRRKDPKLIAAYKPQFKKNWQRIELLATMLSKSETQKWLIILSRNIQEQCEIIFNRLMTLRSMSYFLTLENTSL